MNSKTLGWGCGEGGAFRYTLESLGGCVCVCVCVFMFISNRNMDLRFKKKKAISNHRS